jgi:AcrR family transcriptional regulator
VPRTVKPRRYDATSRQEAAARTRHAILAAAQRLLVERGYAGLAMKDVAAAAEVALDTVYATVGTKPALVRTLIEAAISGTDDAVPAEERDYVRAIRAAATAAEKLRLYAAAVARIHVRLAPLQRRLVEAAPAHPDLAALWQEIASRRAANMRLFAKDLAATGALRKDLTVEEIADILWSTNAPEIYGLLVLDRGWSPARFEEFLADAWQRILL